MENNTVTPNEASVKEKKPNFFSKLWQKIKDKILSRSEEVMTWDRWKRKNLTPAGFGRFCWYIVRLILIIGISFMILYPFVVKAIVAFMSTNDIADNTVMYLPREGSTYFIQKAIMSMDYWTALLNTALMSLGVALLQLLVSTFVGYGFARFKFWGKNLLFFLVIIMLIVPPQTITLPLYVNLNNFFGLRLIDTPFAMFFLAITGLGLKNGLYVYMMRQFFRGMPKELEMSAYIDGAGHFRTFFSIMLPNATNMMITIFLFAFTWQWTDTTYNAMLIPNLQILTNTIMNGLGGSMDADILQTQALVDTSSLLLILPLLIVFLFAQRYFVQSIERSGLVE